MRSVGVGSKKINHLMIGYMNDSAGVHGRSDPSSSVSRGRASDQNAGSKRRGSDLPGYLCRSHLCQPPAKILWEANMKNIKKYKLMIWVLFNGKSEGLSGNPYSSNMCHWSKEIGYVKKYRQFCSLAKQCQPAHRMYFEIQKENIQWSEHIYWQNSCQMTIFNEPNYGK